MTYVSDFYSIIIKYELVYKQAVIVINYEYIILISQWIYAGMYNILHAVLLLVYEMMRKEV